MFWAVLMLVGTVSGSPAAQEKPATHGKPAANGKSNEKRPPGSGPGCQTTKEKEDITITCNYATKPRSASNRADSNRTGDLTIAVRRAVLSFGPTDSSNMEVELTFTNIGAKPISQARAVYLEIDDDAGNNHTRRELPSVDFRKLRPGQSLTFSEELRIAAFPPGHYRIFLWIPDPDKSRMFKAEHNALLANSSADVKTRLNTLADFTHEPFRR
jgi:hypothetical protein